MKIIRHIEYLLTTHNCVILPGLGAILSHGIPALYDEKKSLWIPPMRVFAFNPQIKVTDNLIAASIARREKISTEVADGIVRAEIEVMKGVLDSTHKLSLGHIGSLKYNKEGNLTFTPGKAAWLSPNTMWLPILSPIHDEVIDNAVNRRYAIEARRRQRNAMIRKVASTAAALLILVAIGIFAYFRIPEISEVQFASFLPISHNTESDIIHEDILTNETPAKVILSQEPESESIINNTAATTPKYHLIVASFASLTDAQRFIDEYPQMKLGIIPSEGRYRIFAAAGDSWNDMIVASHSEQIEYYFPTNWVYSH